jgi:DNA-binding CsgD family transcriptional regulator
MKVSGLSEFSQLLLKVYKLAQMCTRDNYQDAVLNEVQKYFHFDSGYWGTGTMTPGGIDVHTLHLYNTPQAMIDDYQMVKHLDAAAEKIATYKSATMAWNIIDMPSNEFRDFLNKYDRRNVVITSSIDFNTNFASWISLFRADIDHIIKDDELQLVEHLAPHLMQGLAINRAIHLDKLVGDTNRECWSVAISDKRGVYYHLDTLFQERIRSDYPTANIKKLPVELQYTQNKMRVEIPLKSSVLYGSLEGDLIYLKIRDRYPVDDLTESEFRVAKLVSSGMSLKEASSALNRSVDTVRTQLKAVYRKLDINKISQLPKSLSLRSMH